MLNDLSIFNLASTLARHAANRHRVISENISNADTPGFRAKDVDPLQGDRALEMIERRDRTAMLERMMEAHEIENASAKPNGNNVAVEDQLARAADAQAQHDNALAIYRKSIDLLRLSFRTTGR